MTTQGMIPSPIEGAAPKYRQIASELAARITSGQLRPGDRLPAESALAAQLGVNTVTVRQAMALLSNQGLVNRRQGIGTFVSAPSGVPVTNRVLDFNGVRTLGADAIGARVLDASLIDANVAIAGDLGVQIGSPVNRVHRVRLVRGRPVGVETGYWSAVLMPDLLSLDLSGDIDELVTSRYGFESWEATQTLEARGATDDEAALLGTEPGAPVMAIDWRMADRSGRVFSCGTCAFLPFAARFTVVSTARDEAQATPG